MTWIIAGLGASLLFALTNLLDQIVVRKYYPDKVLLLMTINGLVQAIPFIGIAIYKPEMFGMNISVILILIMTALINFLGFITYYKAIEKNEASDGIPILQLQPIIIFVGAYFLFNETITFGQAIGAALITGAAISLLIDLKAKSFNWRVLYLMGFCMLALSATTLIDRALLQDYDWLNVLGWKALGYVLAACLVFVVKPSIYKQAVSRFKNLKDSGFQYIITVEMVATTASGLLLLSLAKAPAAGLALTLTGFIPLFVLVLSYAAHKMSPIFFDKAKQGFHLQWHLACLALMLMGLFLINI